MSTLKQQISADVTEVFLVDNDFAEQVTYYPDNDQDSDVTYDAIVDLDDEMGTGLISGGGQDLNDRFGERERRTGRVEITSTLDVVDGDSFLIRGEVWFYKRRAGIDQDPSQTNGLQTILVINTVGRHTRKPRMRRTHKGRQK